MQATNMPRGSFAVTLAATPDDVRAAQRLRYEVFAEELGARLDTPEPGLDIDRFDAFCDHLLLRETGSDRVIGTYRMLTAKRARAAGSYYSETEFHIARLLALGDGLVEVGRACVAPDHRRGAAIAALWTGLLRWLAAAGATTVIGCTSISLAEGGAPVAALCRRLRQEHLGPPELRVFPRRPLPLHRPPVEDEAPMPPLLKAYFRLGAFVCGDPAWDPAFDCADLLVMLPLDRMSRRHASHLLRAA